MFASALKSILSRRVVHKIPRLQHASPLGRRRFHNSTRQLIGGMVAPGQESIEIPNESSENLRLSLRWLRDNCSCKVCRGTDTMQKSFDTFTVLPYDEGVRYSTHPRGLSVRWNNDHQSEYSWEWLSIHARHKLFNIKRKHWGAEIKYQPPSVHYDEIMASDAGVALWTSKIVQYGFCFVDGCPISPEKTQELLERIAFIRTTHYGGFYDFTSDLQMKDTAYTSLALPAHTDNTYFTDPSGLQMFHLLSHTEGTGGASLLVDGYRCAEIMRNLDPVAYKCLYLYPVQWHASGNAGISIIPAFKFPVLNMNYDNEHKPNLLQVRWNTADRGVVPHPQYRGIPVEKWYDAARLWDSIVKDLKNEYWEQLVPGRPIIFDNWRVLHGRSAFTGKRRICGGYVNRDDFMSRYFTTNDTRKQILSRVI